MKRLAVGVTTLVVALLLGTAVAFAVSGGTYRAEDQGCTGHADASDRPDRTEDSCQNAALVVSDGNGNGLARAGTYQTADNETVHRGSAAAGPCQADADAGSIPAASTGVPFLIDRYPDVTRYGPPDGPPSVGCDGPMPAPTMSGAQLYFGADDNLDFGEHDSSERIHNGPSDGGAIRADATPGGLLLWMMLITDPQYLLTHPAPFLVTAGACADGHCADATTQRTVVYQGGGTGSRDAADYQGVKWDPASCAGPTDGRSDCGGRPISSWEDDDGTVYAEPGVQVYEDPDRQASPEPDYTDFGLSGYQDPGVYAGTCGVVVSPGGLADPSTSYGTNLCS